MEEEKMVLTQRGLETLVKEILKTVNERIQGRIVDELNDSSDVNHVPSALKVYEAVRNVSSIKSLVISDGDITKATIAPDPKTLYVVRTEADETNGKPYVYINDVGYIALGSTTLQSGDAEIAAMTDEIIKSAVAAAATNTAPGI